jgi:pyridinium-3,5-biscarboxylic acid mononucleotide sulfurtransferase
MIDEIDLANTRTKRDKLRTILAGLKKVAVAFSGGVDSTFLLFEAVAVLGDDAIAVTAQSPAMPGNDLELADSITRLLHVRHITIPTLELSIPELRANPPDRCYLCKRYLFSEIMAKAATTDTVHVIEGSNWDDRNDYRPGRKALRELQILSPMMDVRLTKPEIRRLAMEAGLPNWDKPAAACLYSRIPYGEEITPERVQRIHAAEQVLLDLGIRMVRVRDHARDIARIEVLSEDIARLAADPVREHIASRFLELGYRFVTLDLAGYQTGSLNSLLPERDVKGCV